MTKCINLELSKKLAPYLKDVDTEYILQQLPNHNKNWWLKERVVKNWNWVWRMYKTLTLEEAIEFMPYIIDLWEHSYWLEISKIQKWYHINYSADISEIENWEDEFWNTFETIFNSVPYKNLHLFWGTLLEAIEKMLEYLLDKNLLWKKQENN